MRCEVLAIGTELFDVLYQAVEGAVLGVGGLPEAVCATAGLVGE